MSTHKQLQCKRSISSAPASPTSSFLRPSRPFAPAPTSASEQTSPDWRAQLEHAARFGHSFAHIPLFPPDYHAPALSSEGQLTDHAGQQKRSVQEVSQASMESIPAESAQLETRQRGGWNFAHIPLFPDPATLPSANTGLPASVDQRLLMRAIEPRPNMQSVSSPSQHPFVTQIMQRRERDEKERQNIPLQKNATGMSDVLKAGVESLSGISMDDVTVHYNSPKPAEVQALAYTQGTEIHVGLGQEQHLPHEAWHVVQQKQGRVKPILQAQSVAINDDQGLEREADVMGNRAIQTGDDGLQGKEGLSSDSVEHSSRACLFEYTLFHTHWCACGA